jgi:8-oxo-dGTP pyrophosphatase MutT (NUDIX family)
VAALQDGLLQLVQQFRYPVGARYWELPQGSSSAHPGDPRGAALLELREETGMVAGRLTHAGRLFEAYGYSNQSFDVFLATELRHVGADLEPEEEGLVSRAFALDEVQRMIVDGTILDAVTVAAFGLLRLKGLL